MKLDKIMIDLLAKEILEKEIDEKAIKDTLMSNEGMIKQLYELSKMHDLAHIICLALKNVGVWGTDEIYKKFQRQQTLAVYRYEHLEYEFKRVCKTLDLAQIPYIPLKGLVIRELYPEAWMRTSSDIDFLVEEKNERRARELLTEKCGYTMKSFYKAEASFLTDKGICIELHYSDAKYNALEFPKEMWENTSPVEGSFCRNISNEMFYYHVVSHLIKHIVGNGCGVKPFFDIYLLENMYNIDYDKTEKMFEKAGILKAYKVLQSVIQSWIDDTERDKLSEILHRYIILSGAYGSRSTSMQMHHHKRGGKFKYIIYLILPDREEMERRYPVLKEHPLRLPFYHLKRWGHLIFKGRIKSSAEIVSSHMSVSDKDAKDLDYMMTQMEMK